MVSALRSRAQDLGRPFPTNRILGTPRAYLEQHRPDQLLAELGLDPEGLAAAFTRLLTDQPEFARTFPESPRPDYLYTDDSPSGSGTLNRWPTTWRNPTNSVRASSRPIGTRYFAKRRP